eukprot:COSAG02_NODE_7466_length_2999_cov_3.327931_3_plen_76_part_00
MTPSIDNSKTLFNRCKWSFKVRRADGKKKEGAPTDTGAHGFVEMPSGTGERLARIAFVVVTMAPLEILRDFREWC